MCGALAATWSAMGGAVTDVPEKLPNGKWVATFADPDGDEFVLLS
jgi:predicted enzyme related to lactoylglutathione lyase